MTAHEASVRKPADLAALIISATDDGPAAVAFLAMTLLEVVRANTPPGTSERDHAVSVLTEVRDGLTRHIDEIARFA